MELPQPKEYPLVVINLLNGEGITLIFPEEIGLKAGARWEPQRVTHGTMPLLYANNDPEELTLSPVWLDGTEEGESVTGRLLQIFALTKKAEGAGAPPPLLVSWGDTEFRCVLTEVTAREEYFDSGGRPMRAELSLTFLELQEDLEPAPQAAAATASPFPTGQVIGGPVFGPEP